MGQIRALFTYDTQQEKFDRYHNTKSYMWNTYKRAFQDLDKDASKQKLRAWAADLGYKKKSFGKFLNKKDRWLTLASPVPIAFFDVMGIDKSVLDYVIELDYQAFEEELVKPYSPEEFIVRAMPTVHFKVDLPEGVSLEEAVRIAQEYADEKRKQAFISVKSLKTVFIRPHQEPKEGFFPPRMKVEGDKYLFV